MNLKNGFKSDSNSPYLTKEFSTDPESVTADKLDEVITNYVKSMPDLGAWPNFALGGDDR